MKRLIVLGLLSAWLAGSALYPAVEMLSGRLFFAQALAWDGQWTQAKSGLSIFDNPGSTDGQAGTDPPQKYYTPAPRDYAEVDPEELDDYFKRRNKEYTPYALARITQDLHYNSWVIPKGYYLVKPGDPDDGSQLVNLKTLNGTPAPDAGLVDVADQPPASPVPADEALKPGDPTTPATLAPTDPASAKKPKGKPKKPVYAVFVIKRQGKVVLVVPIHRRQLYVPDPKAKIPERALAWLEQEDRHPVLKFYYQHWLYSTDFQ